MSIRVHVFESPSRSPRYAIRRALLSLLSLALMVSPLLGQDAKDMIRLEAGRPIQREISGGQPHSYHVDLAAGQFLHATVEQRSVDVVITVFAPDGQRLSVVDDPGSRRGLESVSLIAETPGIYRLDVRPYDPKAVAGRYEIRIDALRDPTAKDRMRLTAEKGLAEARRLARQAQTPEARGQAGDRLEENASLWHQVGDKYWEAVALGALASTRRAQDEAERALTALNQALSLYLALADRRGEASTRYDIGVIHYGRGENAQAFSALDKALPLWQALGERQTVAYTHNYLGLVYRNTRDYERALVHQSQALELLRELKNHEGEAKTLGYLGEVYRFRRETAKALESYGEALKYWRSAGDLAWQASTVYDIGAAYDEADDDEKAVEQYAEALELYRQLKDRRNEAATLYALGTAYDELKDRRKALEVLNQALDIRRELKEPARTATTLYYIGTIHNDLGDRERALVPLAEALPLHRAAGDRYGEARTLNYTGDVYLSMGQNEQARKHYQDALTIRHEINDRRGEVDTLTNLGLLDGIDNKTDDAIKNFTRARTLAREADYATGEALALNGLGNVHQKLEKMSSALTYFNQALDICRKVGDKECEAQTLTYISIAYAFLGQSGKALEANEKASPLIEGLRDDGAEMSKSFNVGMVLLVSGEYQKAIDTFKRTLDMARAAGQEKMFAFVPVLMGFAYYQLNEDQKALELYTSVLPALQDRGYRSVEALANAGIAAIERDRGNLAAARARVENALQIFQSLRGDLNREDLRISIFASAQDYFGAYIDILMSQHRREPAAGHDVEAFQASELGRARSLLDSLSEAKVDIRRGAGEELLRRERSLRQRLSAKAQQRMLRLLGGGDTDVQAQADRDEIESLTIELQQALAEIRQKSLASPAQTQPQPLTLKEIQTQVLDDDTLLLEYSLGIDRSFLWAVTPDSVVSYVLPGRDEIEAAVRKVYELLNARARSVEGETSAQRQRRVAQADTEYPAAAARLSRMVLAPAAQQLGNKRLLIVADGPLQYIPVGALPDPTRDSGTFTPLTPLIAGHEVVGALSASTLALMRRETKGRSLAPRGVAVLADPVFGEDDERLQRKPESSAGKAASRRADAPREIMHDRPAGDGSHAADGPAPHIKRLVYSRQEAKEILKIAGPEGSSEVLDFAANRQFVTDPQLGSYRYLHFATHGFVDSDHPELSGIVLSMVNEKGERQNGFLWAHEIYNLKLRGELVVLSACQTGLGKEVKGEGLMGLTRGFMYAGAPRVVVSLWSVSDRATAELMSRFYRGMLKEKMRPAAALRAAQLSMMKERGWESPFYWAAFTLQGEWR